MKPTPETDAFAIKFKTPCGEKYWVPVDIARKLERELDEAREQRDHWKARCLQQNKDLGYELRDPNGTIWSECKRLQSELTRTNEYADKLAAGLPDGMLPKDVEVLREANLGLAVELTAVTEQRDRLAEALQNVIDEDGTPMSIERADEALQSLTTNETISK